ncbi:MAG: hypothetical protein QOD32_3090 [Pyrinomonadaceae bacterium]|jgi:hypothetical protein|nr:hypothetical protein [Pyrinomonadaceae bacterium]
MIEVDDTKPNAGETATAHLGDESASPTLAPTDSHVVAPDDSHVEPLVLQTDFRAGERSQYHVAELLAFHDQHFVEGVYRAILGRAPFPAEGARALDELRGGRAGKVEIIERLLASPEAGRGVRVEGLPSPLMRRLGRVPVVGYLLRLARALVRLPLSMQHQQQFEIYALAQQQLIADYLNRTLAQFARGSTTTADDNVSTPPAASSPHAETVEALEMFADALLELSNSHAELEARTQTLQDETQTQVEQAQAALAELTAAITAQQQLAETLRREQQLASDAQQEFLIQEQRVIVETQQVILAELREELRALAAKQQRAREEFDAEVRRLRSLQEAAAAARENFSGQA